MIYDILLVQGGALPYFAQIPANNGMALIQPAIVDTGAWSSKASKEAEGDTPRLIVVASSKEQKTILQCRNFSTLSWMRMQAYLHICPMENDCGVEFSEFTKNQFAHRGGINSSTILSRK